MSLLASLIIPTCNRPDDLRRCLGALVPQIPKDGTVDIHIGDDSVSDVTRKLVEKEFPQAKVHSGPRQGPGANRNRAASLASGDWLIFLDDDTIPRPDFLATYLTAIKSLATENVVLAGPTLRIGDHENSMLWEAPRSADAHTLPPSCNFAMSRRVYLAFDGFDERFAVSFEDMEFFARLLHSDVPTQFVPGATVDHPVRPLPPPAKLADRWEARVITCFDYGASSFATLWRLPRHIVMVILSRFRGKKPSVDTCKAALIFVGEFCSFLTKFPGWLKKYGRAPRSPFWIRQVELGKTPPRYGL